MLEGQTMFKQLQELQRQKKLEELNDAKPQHQQLSLMHYKQASGTRYPNGIPVRDPSQMFKFGNGNTNPNSTSRNRLELFHKVDKEYSHVTQFGCTNSAPTAEAPKAEPDDGAFPSYDNASRAQRVGLKLAPPCQRRLVNYFDRSPASSLQAGYSSKPSQDPQSNNNQIGNQNYMTNQAFSPNASQGTSHLVSVKNEDGQQSSPLETEHHPVAAEMAQENICVDVPVQQNPSGMETASEASKGLDYWKHVKSENNFSETDAHMNKSQGLDDGSGFASKTNNGKETLSGNLETDAASGLLGQGSNRDLEALGRSLKQADASPCNHSLVNPMSYDPSRRAVIKIEKITCDDKIPQATSLAQPNSADTEKMSMNDAKVRNNASQILLVGGPPGSLERNSSLVQVASVDQCGSTGTNKVALPRFPSFYSQHLDVANQNMVVLKSKKRKYPTFERLPWHEVVTEGCLGLHDTSTAEMEWARSANRLPEKLKEEAREVTHSRKVVDPKRRLILTTQLMQLLFRPVPALAPSEDATANCDTVTYYAAKLALGDACSLAGHSRMSHDISGLSSRTSMIPKRFDHQNLSKTVQGFIDRSKRLEDELLRLEGGESSILDLRVEFQNLDKFSVSSRFAKFHRRGPFGSADTASSGGASTVPKLYPQRYVTASPMPKMVPEGLRCLSI